MSTNYRIRKLRRDRRIRRQRSALFMMLVVVLSLVIAHSAFSKPDNISGEYSVVSVTVQPGDTLWTIAKEYKPAGADLRAYVYEIAENNGVEDCNIIPGQVLFVPII